jgi:hypothetical protein
MTVLQRLERRRWVVWVAWPIAALVLPIAIVRTVAAVRGWGLYYALDLGEVLQMGIIMFGPPVLFEVLLRKGRNDG